MAIQQTAEYEKGLTFEKVWAALMENREQLMETDRIVQETARQMKETDRGFQETKKLVDRVTANMGGLNNTLGELVENLIAARLWEKFDAYPYNLKQAYQRMPLYEGHTSRVLTDIDILLANGEYAMAVEVKAHLDKTDDVDHHLKRMELIRKYPPAQCVGRKLLGAMAGGSVDPDVQAYAQHAGFFVLELTGENVALAECPAGFKPREW
ncbi:hypothetical protein FACS189485_14440 [Spirochaetia bacterium]|nr:hypothetical protein FACS189485_14440 [Spirochaetia bacterium]